MNTEKDKIIADIYRARNGHYCHSLECENIEDFISSVEILTAEWVEKYTPEQILYFFNTIEIYFEDDDYSKLYIESIVFEAIEYNTY